MIRIRILWLLIGLIVGALIASGGGAPKKAPSLAEITTTINRMAKTGARIDLSKHAWQRMGERRMSIEEIRTVLANGTITVPPRTGDEGDLIYKVEDEDTRGTEDGEVVVIPREDSLFIVTVMWGE